MKKIEEMKKVVPSKTLRELGIPSELAIRFEIAFQALGATRRGQIVGYTFRTPDDVSHRLRLNSDAGEGSDGGPTDLAA